MWRLSAPLSHYASFPADRKPLLMGGPWRDESLPHIVCFHQVLKMNMGMVNNNGQEIKIALIIL